MRRNDGSRNERGEAWNLGGAQAFCVCTDHYEGFRGLAGRDPHVALFLCNKPACKDYQPNVQFAANSVSQVSRNVKAFTT